eukprot:258907_1
MSIVTLSTVSKKYRDSELSRRFTGLQQLTVQNFNSMPDTVKLTMTAASGTLAEISLSKSEFIALSSLIQKVTAPSASWADLPLEIQAFVFGFLPFQKTFGLHTISKSARLASILALRYVKNVRVRCQSLELDRFGELVSKGHLKRLQSVYFEDTDPKVDKQHAEHVTKIGKITRCALIHCPNLRGIYPYILPDSVVQSPQSFPNLQSLGDLSGRILDSNVNLRILSDKVPSLTTLDLRGDMERGATRPKCDSEKLTHFVKSCKQLTTLCVDRYTPSLVYGVVGGFTNLMKLSFTMKPSAVGYLIPESHEFLSALLSNFPPSLVNLQIMLHGQCEEALIEQFVPKLSNVTHFGLVAASGYRSEGYVFAGRDTPKFGMSSPYARTDGLSGLDKVFIQTTNYREEILLDRLRAEPLKHATVIDIEGFAYDHFNTDDLPHSFPNVQKLIFGDDPTEIQFQISKFKHLQTVLFQCDHFNRTSRLTGNRLVRAAAKAMLSVPKLELAAWLLTKCLKWNRVDLEFPVASMEILDNLKADLLKLIESRTWPNLVELSVALSDKSTVKLESLTKMVKQMPSLKKLRVRNLLGVDYHVPDGVARVLDVSELEYVVNSVSRFSAE